MVDRCICKTCEDARIESIQAPLKARIAELETQLATALETKDATDTKAIPWRMMAIEVLDLARHSPDKVLSDAEMIEGLRAHIEDLAEAATKAEKYKDEVVQVWRTWALRVLAAFFGEAARPNHALRAAIEREFLAKMRQLAIWRRWAEQVLNEAGQAAPTSKTNEELRTSIAVRCLDGSRVPGEWWRWACHRPYHRTLSFRKGGKTFAQKRAREERERLGKIAFQAARDDARHGAIPWPPLWEQLSTKDQRTFIFGAEAVASDVRRSEFAARARLRAGLDALKTYARQCLKDTTSMSGSAVLSIIQDSLAGKVPEHPCVPTQKARQLVSMALQYAEQRTATGRYLRAKYLTQLLREALGAL